MYMKARKTKQRSKNKVKTKENEIADLSLEISKNTNVQSFIIVPQVPEAVFTIF